MAAPSCTKWEHGWPEPRHGCTLADKNATKLSCRGKVFPRHLKFCNHDQLQQVLVPMPDEVLQPYATTGCSCSQAVNNRATIQGCGGMLFPSH